jgi:5-methylcytosine-specific restriction endonuclease McrA
MARSLKPKPKAGGRWTIARYRAFIKSLLRAGTMRWAPKYDALKAAYVKRGVNPKTGRMSKLHKCNSCCKLFPMNAVRVDHILPVVDPAVGFVSWDSYIERMFCEVENLQVLCNPCHDFKTKSESKKSRKAVHFKPVRFRTRS